MGKKIASVLVISSTLLFLLLSCDAFFLGPAMNLNRDDPDISFGRLECEIIEDDEIRVVWDWYDIERVLRGRDSVYDEIVIKHNQGSYPVSRLGGKSFSISSWDPFANPITSTIFTDLKRDREHYFALYAHEAGGGWMAPVYSSKFLERGGNRYPKDLYPNSGNALGGDLSFSGSFITIANNVYVLDDNNFNIFYYDLWQEENILSAEMNITVSNVPLETTLSIYPMRAMWTSGDPPDIDIGGADEYVVDRTIRVDRTFLTGETGDISIDITDLFAKAQYHRTQGIFIITGGGQISLDYSSNYPMIATEIMEDW